MNIYRNSSEERIYNALCEHAESLGYEIVRLHIFNGTSGVRLQIMIDRIDGKPVKIEDCEKVNNAFSPIFDVENLINSNYNLEISSPGINRPLTRKKDYASSINEKVKVNTYNLINDSKSFIGTLLNCDEDCIQLRVLEDCEILKIKFDSIRDAMLLKI